MATAGQGGEALTMRSEAPDPPSGSPKWSRLSGPVDRARRLVADQGPLARMASLAAVLGVLVALGYLIAAPDSGAMSAWVFDGQRFPAEEAGRLVRELASRTIPARVDDGRVEVPESRLAEAQAALSKLGLAPASIRSLADAPAESGLLQTPSQIEQDTLRRRSRLIEAALHKLDDRLASFVQIRRSAPRGLAPAGPLKMTVFLDVADGRSIPPELVEKIRVVVQSLEPDLAPEDGLWLCDSRGTPYLMPGAAALGQQSRRRARESQLRADIERQLDWISGVRVGVSLDADATLPELPVPVVEVVANASSPSPSPGPAPSATGVIVSVNAPPEPEEDAGPPSPPSPVVEPTASDASAHAHAVDMSRPSVSPERVRVVVRVPSTYYLDQARAALGTSGSSPSPEDLGSLAARTEASIRRAVGLIVGSEALADLDVDRIFIPTATSAARPAPVLAAGQASAWWRPAALGGFVATSVLGLVLIVGRVRSDRARKRRRSGRAPSSRARTDPASTVRPGERARDLVRHDPDAAAAVLQRWIGSNGGGPAR
jgi:hypothetical protein